MKSVYAKICNIQSGIIEINNRHIESTTKLYRWLMQVEVLATKAAMAPAVRHRPNVATSANPEGGGSYEPSNLTGNPPNLHVVWNDYERGVGGNKPAKYFTKTVCGRVKHMYYRRLVLWKGVEKMIARGTICDTAIESIYYVYKPLQKVTAILDAIRINERNGGHALLH